MADPAALDNYSIADLEQALRIRTKQQQIETRAQAALNLLKGRITDDTPLKHGPEFLSLTSKSRYSLGPDLDLTPSRVPVNVFVQFYRLLSPQQLKDLSSYESTFSEAILLLRGHSLHDYWFNYYILLRKSNPQWAIRFLHESTSCLTAEYKATSPIDAPDAPEHLAVPTLDFIPTDQLSRPQKRARSNEPSSQNNIRGYPTSSTIDKSRAPCLPDKFGTALSVSSTDSQQYEPGNTIPTPSPSLPQLGVSQGPSVTASTFRSFEPVNHIDTISQVEHGRTGLPINSIINTPIPFEYPPPYDSSETGQGNTLNSKMSETPASQRVPIEAVRNLTGMEVGAFLEKSLRSIPKLDLIMDGTLPEGMLSYSDIRLRRESATPDIRILFNRIMGEELIKHALHKVEGNSVIEFDYDRRMYSTAQEP